MVKKTSWWILPSKYWIEVKCRSFSQQSVFCGFFQLSELSSVTQQLEKRLFHDFTYSELICSASVSLFSVSTLEQSRLYMSSRGFSVKFSLMQAASVDCCVFVQPYLAWHLLISFQKGCRLIPWECAVGKQSNSSMTPLFCFDCVRVCLYMCVCVMHHGVEFLIWYECYVFWAFVFAQLTGNVLRTSWQDYEQMFFQEC